MPIDDLTALGQKMREARKKKDLTQQELADLSHVSVKQIAKKQAEQEAKDKAAMEKFGVDFDSYTSDDIKEKNVASLKEIASSLAGSKMYSFGSLLSGNSNETFALEMSRAQVEQNFILMRQNEEIIRLLKQIAEK